MEKDNTKNNIEEKINNIFNDMVGYDFNSEKDSKLIHAMKDAEINSALEWYNKTNNADSYIDKLLDIKAYLDRLSESSNLPGHEAYRSLSKLTLELLRETSRFNSCIMENQKRQHLNSFVKTVDLILRSDPKRMILKYINAFRKFNKEVLSYDLDRLDYLEEIIYSQEDASFLFSDKKDLFEKDNLYERLLNKLLDYGQDDKNVSLNLIKKNTVRSISEKCKDKQRILSYVFIPLADLKDYAKEIYPKDRFNEFYTLFAEFTAEVCTGDLKIDDLYSSASRIISEKKDPITFIDSYLDETK